MRTRPSGRRRLVVAIALTVGALTPTAALGAPSSDRVLVELAPGADRTDRAAVEGALGASGSAPVVGRWRSVALDSPVTADAAAAALRQDDADDAVLRVEVDAIVRPTTARDPLHHGLWGIENTGQRVAGVAGVAGADIGATQAWEAATTRGPVTVAVIDTGVDRSHPDLRERMWTNPDEVVNGRDDDGNGLVDDVHGWDLHNDDATVFDGASDAHGTHVAGTIAAAHDGAGVAGVAPNARIMPIKFLGPYGGYTSNAVAAIDYARAKGARVINASWGGGAYSSALRAAIDRAVADGIVFVAAAGNANADIDATPFYPAAYPNPGQLTVAATDNRDRRAWFSNHGTEAVDVAAPGSSILSTTPGDAHRRLSGTSMAAPHVAGAAAVLLGENPDLTPAEVREALVEGSERVPALADTSASGGRVDLMNALTRAGVAGGPGAEAASPTTPVADPVPAPPVAPPAVPLPAPVDAARPVAASVEIMRPRDRTVTRSRRPAVRFASGDGGAPAAAGRLLVDGVRVAASARAGVLRPSAPLRDGVHTLVVETVGAGGRTDVSDPVRITVDRTAPTRPAIARVRTGRARSVRWTAAADGRTGRLSYRLGVDGGGGRWTMGLRGRLPKLRPGRHVVRVDVRDAAGNRSRSAPVHLVVRRNGPTVVVGASRARARIAERRAQARRARARGWTSAAR